MINQLISMYKYMPRVRSAIKQTLLKLNNIHFQLL